MEFVDKIKRGDENNNGAVKIQIKLLVLNHYNINGIKKFCL